MRLTPEKVVRKVVRMTPGKKKPGSGVSLTGQHYSGIAERVTGVEPATFSLGS